jgi:DNA-binding CsgD family transcriptional regulator
MAGNRQRRNGNSSLIANPVNVRGPRWRDLFNDRSSSDSNDTVASRVRLAVDSLSCLTPREREVLVHFLRHLDDKKVARSLGTSVHTVRNQLASIMDKLSLESRMELIATIVFQSLRE